MKTKLGLCLAAVVGLALPAVSADHPGKAVFDDTCKYCHGAEGKSNPTVESFYKVKIPSLASAYVKSKTDGELREIVTGGKGKMEPVTAGFRPTAPHSKGKKLTDEQVTDVIAYIRTLRAQD
jgi:mono/diheme cytochrome c family protein